MTQRILHIADRDFASREHELLARVEAGLRSKGAAIVRAIPQGVADWDSSPVEMIVPYDDLSGFFVTARAHETILSALHSEDAPRIFAGSSPLDIVHAWGSRCFKVAAELACEVGAQLVFDISSTDAVSALRSVKRVLNGCQEASRPGVSLLACDDVLFGRCKGAIRGAEARLVPWGTEVGPEPAARASGPATICVMCTGRSRRGVTAALDGIAAYRSANRDVLVFLDEQALDRTASLHRRVESLELDDCLSVIGNMESARSLILESDVLIAPDLYYEHRSLVLDALAHGMGVIVHEGSFLPVPSDEPAYDVLPRGESDLIAKALGGLLEIPENRRQRALTAREYVRTYHDVRTHLRRLRDAYDAAVAPASVPIGEGERPVSTSEKP